MTLWSIPCTDLPAKARALVAGLLLLACCSVPIDRAAADPVAARGNYLLVVKLLTPLAFRGNAQAQAFLGLMFENGYGAPQVYDTAADLYFQAATRGNPFGQAMLGLMYDKGHGVPQDFILAYKWLNLAAARSPKREQRDYFIRLRDAVASKLSPAQIAQGQRLAILWAVGLP